MKHDFIDKYSGLNSVLHRLDPRVKLSLSFCFLVMITTAESIPLFGLYIVFTAILSILSRVPFRFYLKKMAAITPVALVISFFIYISYLIEHGAVLNAVNMKPYPGVYLLLAVMILKIYLSILVITLMVSSTRFNDVLWALRKLKMPLIVTTLSKLVYTYIFVFIDEMHRTFRAYKSRTPVRRVPRFKVYGNIAAGILLRSMERSDYIYKAMISRGFCGDFPEGNTHQVKLSDLTAVLIFLVIASAAGILWNI